jgi:hypothetical protein
MSTAERPPSPQRRLFLRTAGGAAVGAVATAVTARPAAAADANAQGVPASLSPATVNDTALALECHPGSGGEANPKVSGSPGGQVQDLFQARAWVVNDSGQVVQANRVFYLNEKGEMRVTASHAASVPARIKQATYGDQTADLLQFADASNTTVLSRVSPDGSFRAGQNGTALIGSKYLSSQVAAPNLNGKAQPGDIAVGPKGLWVNDGSWHFVRGGPDVLALTRYAPTANEGDFSTSSTSAVCVETGSTTVPAGVGNTAVQFVAPAFVQKVVVRMTALARVTNPGSPAVPPRLYFNLRTAGGNVPGAVGVVTECPWFTRVSHDVVVDLPALGIDPGETVTWYWSFRVQNPTDVGSIHWGASSGGSYGCPMTMTVTAARLSSAAD